MYDDVTYVWWCDIWPWTALWCCMMMWHMYDDVTYVWWCDICMMMWHMTLNGTLMLYDDVTYVWCCDICMMMWHMYDDVTYDLERHSDVHIFIVGAERKGFHAPRSHFWHRALIFVAVFPWKKNAVPTFLPPPFRWRKEMVPWTRWRGPWTGLSCPPSPLCSMSSSVTTRCCPKP